MDKINGYRKFLFIGFIFLIGCSKDDTPETEDNLNNSIDNFYKGSDMTASGKKLSGIWAIFSVGFQGEKADVPIPYESCGRDFFVYGAEGSYNEYLYQDTSCETQSNELHWELKKGVLTLSNDLGQTDEFVIMKLTDEELVFKSKFDVDEDGTLDVLVLFAKKYEPKDFDFISETFNQNSDDAYENLLSVTWKPYKGVNKFDRYEIFRSSGDNCSKSNADRIAVIKDIADTEFTDLDPPAKNTLCYFLKVYTDKGLMAESRLIDLHTEYIRADQVALDKPLVMDNQISLNWKPYQSPYFSYYEVVFSNYPPNASAYGFQEISLAIINDKDVTTFTDENPPYLENPYYAVFAYNIFGNKSLVYNSDHTYFWEVPYKRSNLLDFQSLSSYALDSDEPIIYLYGEERSTRRFNIHKYNYNTNEMEAVSNISNSHRTYKPIKLSDSPNGKEIVLELSTELNFYDAQTLEYKYAIDPDGILTIDDFYYLSDKDLWVIADRENVYTLKRDNANLFIIDSSPHFTQHQGAYPYQVYPLNDNRIMIGQPNEPNSMVFQLDSQGNFLDKKTVPIRASYDEGNKLLYNYSGNYIIDLMQNRLYSGETFQFMGSFETPYFPSGVSKDGLKIYGTNNDPDWTITPESLHKKEAIIFDRNTKSFEKIETLGYPHILFENNSGGIMSISSGLKKERLSQNINDKADIFIEKVDTH